MLHHCHLNDLRRTAVERFSNRSRIVVVTTALCRSYTAGDVTTDRRDSRRRCGGSSWSPRDSAPAVRHRRTTSWALGRCSCAGRCTAGRWCPARRCRSRRTRSHAARTGRRSSDRSVPTSPRPPPTTRNAPETPRSDRILHAPYADRRKSNHSARIFETL